MGGETIREESIAVQSKAGIVGAALAALTIVIAGVAQILGHAKAQQEGYTTALEQDNKTIGENVRLQALKQLTDVGAVYTAKQMGIGTRDLIDATLGQGDAYGRVTATIKEYSTGTKVQQVEAKRLSNLLGEQRDALKSSVAAQKEQDDAVSTSTSLTAAQTAEIERNAAAAGVSVDAYKSVDQSQSSMADKIQQAAAQMYIQNDAAGLLHQTLDILNGKALSAAEAQNRFESQLVSTAQQVSTNGGALDGMSQSAIQNRGSILNLIQSSEDAATTFRNQGGAADEARQKMVDGRQAIIDQMVANGMNRDSVTAYVTELYKIPDKIPPTKLEVDTSRAEASIAELTRQRTMYIEAVYYRANQPDLNGPASGSGRPGLAYGGTIPGAADGVTAPDGGTVRGNGSAWSDTAGLYRLANGEEVISNTVGQAGRYRSLLKAIGQNASAGQIAGQARRIAGVSGATPAQPAGVVNNFNVYVTGVQQENPMILGRIVGGDVKRALAGVRK